MNLENHQLEQGSIIISDHARTRMSQRYISEANVKSVIMKGDRKEVRENQFGEAWKYVLTKEQLIELQWNYDFNSKDTSLLNNLAVISADIGENKLIITAYRDVHPDDRKALARSVKIGSRSI